MTFTRSMSPPPHYDAHLTSQPNGLTPYLRLPHLLSLTWLAYPILSLVFVIFRLIISSDQSQEAIANAKGDLLTSCKAAEQAATAAASMPRYMAVATNQQIADAVNGTMQGARAALVLSLTIMETIINFLVDIYRSTLLCFVELVVRGGLSILISAVQEISNFIESTLNGLRTSIQSDIQGANSAINSTINAINKVNPFSDIKPPQISVPSLDSLQNVQIPTDFEDTLKSLNNSLPTFSEIKDKIESIIDTPFELLKKDINDTFANLTFDSSVLPVPEQNRLTFCDQLDTSVVDDLGHDLIKITKIGIIILAVLVIVMILGNCALEWYKWRCLKQHLQYTREAWVSDPTLYHAGAADGTPTVRLSDHNLLLLQASSSHPLLTRIANQLSALLRLSPTKHTNLQWFFHYVFHPPALACFLIGFFGLLSVELQLLAVHPLAAKYQAQAVNTATDFSNTIATSINASMYNQSSLYANDINDRLDSMQSTINDGVFGWVNGTTTTLNDTLVTFYDEVQSAVSAVFNGTILEEPVQEFIKCFIGSKVDAFESALTFLHDNLHVNIARVNESVLVLSPDQVNEASRPIAAAAIGGGNDDNEGLVGRLVNSYVSSLKKERVMFALFLGLWGLVVLMALAIIFWHSYAKHWVEARRRRKWEKDQRDFGLDPNVGPHDVLADEKGMQSTGPFGFMRPAPRRSSESFFEHPRASDAPSRTISSPRRLMAVGSLKRVTTRDAAAADASKSPETPGWLRPLIRKLTHRPSADADDAASIHSANASFRERRPPNLTISTAPGPAAPNPSAELKSAWSASPAPTTARRSVLRPWTQHIVPSPPPQGAFPALEPKERRKASVPTDVTPENEAEREIGAPPRFVAPMPLHQAWATRRDSRLAPPPPPPPHPSRRPALAVNPFSTPFDDETSPHPPRSSARFTNPFAGVAI